MLKRILSVLAAALLLTVFLSGTAAAVSIADVEAMAAELAASDCCLPELCLRYQEYRQQRAEVISYTVVKGDTLTGIAQRFGVSLASICASNSIENPNLILVGQVLEFPKLTGLLYTVAPGDTLPALAARYEVEFETIWFANSLLSDKLAVGDKLVIPGAKLPNPLLRSRPVSRSAVRVNCGLNWPLVGALTSTYGMRRGSFHFGIDIAGKVGTPITAAAAGTVTSAGWVGSYGYMVQLRHSSGLSTLYAHACKLNCAVGDNVSQGDIIAFVGATGNATGPHLHFEIKINGSNVNPLTHLP